MFAVIKTGGKQYKVATNDEIVIEKLDADVDGEFTFEDVLMLGDGNTVTVGSPTVAGASVTAEIVDQRKGEKVLVVKKQQRSTYRRRRGHRQLETLVRITAISTDGKKPAKKAAPAKKAEPKAEVKAEAPKKAPAKKAEPKAAPAAKAAPKADAKPKADARGRLDKPQGKADDLKQIKGVGPVLEKKLNEAGIFHYWQVAELKAKQIEELEGEMNFPGRIERDEWVAQAKELAKGA